jgi:hypothetical protein
MASAAPNVSFSTFLVSVASSALSSVGEGGRPADVELAMQTLELLDLLAVKTRGNLDEEEQRLLEVVRSDLRSRLAQVAGGSAGTNG